MRQAITTKYHGVVGKLGARISATARAGRVYIAYDYAASAEANHRSAARKLADKYKWKGEWHGGCVTDSHYVFVAKNSYVEDTFVTDGE